VDTATQVSLLDRLRDGDDPLVWREFYDRYWRALYAFARGRGCADATAEDVVQDVMLTVFEKRDVFRYEPARGRFRNWLFTVLSNSLGMRRRKEKRGPHALGGATDGLAHAPGDAPAPDAAWQAAFEGSLLFALLDTVRGDIEPETYQAFELTTLHGLPAAEAAELTGLTRNAVYLARKRVLARLKALGAPYERDGELGSRVKAVLALSPPPAAERSMTVRVQSTLAGRREAPRG